jgi:DNA polymerase sliding clamp subunit (PCNA homolog)
VQENENVIIESDDTHFKIKGLSPIGYPSITQVNAENTFSLRQGLVKDMIRKTIFAVSCDENMPIITGTLIECKKGQLTFVSMDRTRMAIQSKKGKKMLRKTNT